MLGKLFGVATLCLLLLVATLAAAGSGDEGAVAVLLRQRLAGNVASLRLDGDRELLRGGKALQRFYRQREFAPAWSDGRQLTPAARELLAAIPAAHDEGLDPRNYHYHAIAERRDRMQVAPNPFLAVEFDLLCSDAFMLLASHYLGGRINPATIDSEWHIKTNEGDPARLLQQALAGGHLSDSLAALLPATTAYADLRNAYARYRQLAAAGGWPTIKLRGKLVAGERRPEVVLLRQRLAVTGDLATAGGDDLYDEALYAAVRLFQQRHGLTADGVVGQGTLAALNVSAAERTRQLLVNLERWRWLPRHFGSRYILVNVPAFHLDLVEDGRVVLDMRVIVGRPLRHTPVFIGTMTYLVLNPYWDVPFNIATKDIIPKVRKDPGYMASVGMRIFDRPGGREIDPASLDWNALGRDNFPYHLREDPGPKNSLGRLKFIFPNEHNVYLHDTPARELFERDVRSFSSGCIRIQKPLELATRLLVGTPLASSAALEEALQSGEMRTVTLPTPIPVYLLYATAWAEGGEIHFRNDLYRRDIRLAEALARIPTGTR